MTEKRISHNQLRSMTAAKLRELGEVAHIVEVDKQPVAVLISYDVLVKIQDQLDTLWEEVCVVPQVRL